MLKINNIQTCPLSEIRGMPPETVFSAFSSKKGSSLLLSGGNIDSDHSFIAFDPAAFVTLEGENAYFEHSKQKYEITDPLEFIDEYIASNKNEHPADIFTAGAVGYISYDYRTRIEKLPCANPGAQGLPDIYFSFPSVILAFNHVSLEWSCSRIEYSINGKNAVVQGSAQEDILEKIEAAEKSEFPVIDTASLNSNFSEQEYIQAVEKTRDYIINGDIYQANISRQFSVNIKGDPYPLFKEIFRNNPAPFFAYLNCGNHYVLSSSPELLLRVTGDHVESKPIKGTAPRLKDKEADLHSRQSLKESTKDAAELSMIVDLVRNDIGKVCKGGSVKVKKHREVQAYTNVYHTLSTICGQREENTRVREIIHAVFPGGSITGCPKIRSMEIIDEIEKTRRHIYTGSIGFIAANGDMELNIAIRTALVTGERLYFSAGGGIVYDSDGKKEYDETTDKAGTWLRFFRD